VELVVALHLGEAALLEEVLQVGERLADGGALLIYRIR